MSSPTKETSGIWWEVCAALLVIPVLLQPLANPDIFWHLKSAELILQTDAIPRVDLLSYTLLGAPWVDFEWLIQLIYYGIHAAAGFPGLLALKALMMGMAALPVWALADLHGLPRPQRAALILFWGALVLGRSDLKPETFSVILFSIALWVLEARRLGRLPEYRPAQWAAGAFFFFAFWANLHLAFVSGFLLIAAYGLDRPRETWRATALLLAAAVAGTFVNPYGPGLYQVLSEHGHSVPIISRQILEWQPPHLENPYDGPTWLLLALTAVVLIVQSSWRRFPPTPHIAAATIFGAMFLVHSRQKAFLIPVGLLILIESARPLSTWLRRRRIRIGRFLIVLWTSAYLGYIGHLASPQLLRHGAFSMGMFPVGAADFIERELPQLRKRRIFNQWGWGGYLGYRFHPELRVFMDGRYIFHSFLKNVADAHESPLTWQDFLTAHDIEWLLIRNSSRYVQVRAPTDEDDSRVALLPQHSVYYPSQRWALVYRDSLAVLYVRRGAFPEDWITRHEIR